jgi:hypothetical protein
MHFDDIPEIFRSAISMRSEQMTILNRLLSGKGNLCGKALIFTAVRAARLKLCPSQNNS